MPIEFQYTSTTESCLGSVPCGGPPPAASLDAERPLVYVSLIVVFVTNSI